MSDSSAFLSSGSPPTVPSADSGTAASTSVQQQRRAIVLLPVRETHSGGLEVLLGQRDVENVLGGGCHKLVPFAGELLGVGGRLRRNTSETPLEVALQELAACGFAVSQRTRLHNITRFDRLVVTSSISGTAYDVQTFVVWAEDNPSTLDPDIEFINFQLTEKRRRRQRLIASGAFQRLSETEKLLWSPRIVSLHWWPLDVALETLHPSKTFINSYQQAEFERLGHEGRDVAVGTSHALKHLRDIGSRRAFREHFIFPRSALRSKSPSTFENTGITAPSARRSRSWDSSLSHAGDMHGPAPAPTSRNGTDMAPHLPGQIIPLHRLDCYTAPVAQRARSGTAGDGPGGSPLPQWLSAGALKLAAGHSTQRTPGQQRTIQTPSDAPSLPDVSPRLVQPADGVDPFLPLPSAHVYAQDVFAGRKPAVGPDDTQTTHLHQKQQPQHELLQPQERVTILSYNLNALPVGASMVSSHSSHFTGERIDSFVAHLGDLKRSNRAPHVLALQEVFATPISPLICFQTALLRRLDDIGYSYVARMPRPTAYDVLVHGKYTDSGLLIVSSLPITASDFHAFSTAGSGLDAGAAKGVVWARVALSAGFKEADESDSDQEMLGSTSTEIMVDIFNCHLQASHTSGGAYTAVRAAQMLEMLSFIKLRTHNSPFPFVLMGDFNVDGVSEQPGEHIGMPYFSSRLSPGEASSAQSAAAASTAGTTDSAEYCRLHQQLQGAITRMPLATGNHSSTAPLGALIDVLKQRHGRQISTRPPRQQYPRSIQYAYVHKYPQRLDYLWYAEGEAGQLVADIKSVQVHPFRVGGAPFRYLSDHYGLSVQLTQEQFGGWLEAPQPVVLSSASDTMDTSNDERHPVQLPPSRSAREAGARRVGSAERTEAASVSLPAKTPFRRSQSCVELAQDKAPSREDILTAENAMVVAAPEESDLGLPARTADVLRLVTTPAPQSWLARTIHACSPRYWSYVSLFAYRSRAWAILHSVLASLLVLLGVALCARVAVALLPCQASYMQSINEAVFLPVKQVCVAAQQTVEFPENSVQYIRQAVLSSRERYFPALHFGLLNAAQIGTHALQRIGEAVSVFAPAVLCSFLALGLFLAVFAFDWTTSNAWCAFVHLAVHGPAIPEGLPAKLRLWAIQSVDFVHVLPARAARLLEAAALKAFHRIFAERPTTERLYNLAVIPSQTSQKQNMAQWLFVTFVGRRPLRNDPCASVRRGPSSSAPKTPHTPRGQGEFFIDDAKSVSSHQHILDTPAAFHASWTTHTQGNENVCRMPDRSPIAEYLHQTTNQYLLWAGVHRPLSLRVSRKKGSKHETWKMHLYQMEQQLSAAAVLPVLRWALDQSSAAATYGTRRSAERYVTEFTADSSVASQRSVRLLRMNRKSTRSARSLASDRPAAEQDDPLVEHMASRHIPLPAAGGAVPSFTRQYTMLALLQPCKPSYPPSIASLIAAQRHALHTAQSTPGAPVDKISLLPGTAPEIISAACRESPSTLYGSLLNGARQHGTRRAVGWLAEDEPTFLGAFSSADVKGISWWSYTDLISLASCFGAGLVRLARLRPGSKVGILAVESREWLIADAACACFGLVSCALHCPSQGGLHKLLDASQCDAVLCSRRFTEAVLNWCAHDHTSPSQPFIVQIQPIEYSERMAALELGVPLHTMEFIVSAGKAHPLAHSPPLPEDNATELYSWRNTTDGDLVPVPILLTHRGLTAAFLRFRSSTPGSLLTAADTYLSQLPLPDMAERSFIHVCLQVGACVVFGVENTNAVLHQLHVVRPTVMATTPKLMEHLFCHFLRIRRSWSAWYRKVYIESFSQKSVSLFESGVAVRSAMASEADELQKGCETGNEKLSQDIENVTTLLSPSQRWSDATFFQSSASLLGTANLKMLLVVCTRDSGGFSARPDVRDFAQVAMCTPVVEVFSSQRFGVLFCKPVNLTPVVPHARSPAEVTCRECPGSASPSDLTNARRSILEQSSRLAVGDVVPGLTMALEPLRDAPGVFRVSVPLAQRSADSGELVDSSADFGQPRQQRLRRHVAASGSLWASPAAADLASSPMPASPTELACDPPSPLSDIVGIQSSLCSDTDETNSPQSHLFTVDTGILLRWHGDAEDPQRHLVFCGMRDSLVPVISPTAALACSTQPHIQPQLLCLQRLEQIVHCCCGMLQRVWVAMPPAVPTSQGTLQLPPIVVASVFPEQAYSWANECNVPSLANAASATAICAHPSTQAYVLQRIHESAKLGCVHLSALERKCLKATAGVILLADTLVPPLVTPQGGLNRPALWRAHSAACTALYSAMCANISETDIQKAIEEARLLCYD